MPLPVAANRSDASDTIARAAEVIGRSAHRAAIFAEVCRGHAKCKTVSELVARTGIPRQQVLNAAKKLVHNEIINQVEKDGEVAYEKDSFLAANKRKVLQLANKPDELKRFPTKTNPRVATGKIELRIPRALVRTLRVTVDDVDSFRKVKGTAHNGVYEPLKEQNFKAGMKRVLGEVGKFEDWGGEKNDLWTTRLRLGGRRLTAAFAFKGRGTRGKLTPGKMGANGDQIQRLFATGAEVLFVQYWGQIDESVLEQMDDLAVAKSYGEGGRQILYGIIDGDDSNRLIEAHPDEFKGVR